MKTKKSKFPAFACALFASAAISLAGMATLITHSGDPNGAIAADAGQVCSDTSTGQLWVKTGTTAKNGWQSINASALGNAVRGTVTLTNGTGTIANSAFSTNSVALLTSSGATTPSAPLRASFSGTVATITGGTNTTTAAYLIFNP